MDISGGSGGGSDNHSSDHGPGSVVDDLYRAKVKQFVAPEPMDHPRTDGTARRLSDGGWEWKSWVIALKDALIMTERECLEKTMLNILETENSVQLGETTTMLRPENKNLSVGIIHRHRIRHRPVRMIHRLPTTKNNSNYLSEYLLLINRPTRTYTCPYNFQYVCIYMNIK